MNTGLYSCLRSHSLYGRLAKEESFKNLFQPETAIIAAPVNLLPPEKFF
ncbi:hypothetical protein ACFS7Z_11770 [Pontibacter toksunensis]|uniref:Uncharacterized protein n=1 Tax=Pontibacter toksunensis TaxID=1332631 RepID=A0ABW6BUT1_9BACT